MEIFSDYVNIMGSLVNAAVSFKESLQESPKKQIKIFQKYDIIKPVIKLHQLWVQD